MKLRRVKNSWLFSNKHYLIPVFLLLSAVNMAVALLFAFLALIVWGVNKLRARLPIDSGVGGEFETIGFKTIGTTELKLDLWKPRGGGSGIATVVFAHGGGWISGLRNQPNVASWCRFLSSRGFSVASIDYRFAYTHNMADIISDFSDAVDFIRSQAGELGINRKIILMGLSAGGHLALCHAAFNTIEPDSDAMEGVRGVIAYYSPSDLNDLFSTDDKSFFARFGASAALKTIPMFDDEIYHQYSPINHFSDKMVPVLAVHGRQDEVGPYF
jgi:acetyl esterase/lipase